MARRGYPPEFRRLSRFYLHTRECYVVTRGDLFPNVLVRIELDFSGFGRRTGPMKFPGPARGEHSTPGERAW